MRAEWNLVCLMVYSICDPFGKTNPGLIPGDRSRDLSINAAIGLDPKMRNIFLLQNCCHHEPVRQAFCSSQHFLRRAWCVVPCGSTKVSGLRISQPEIK